MLQFPPPCPITTSAYLCLSSSPHMILHYLINLLCNSECKRDYIYMSISLWWLDNSSFPISTKHVGLFFLSLWPFWPWSVWASPTCCSTFVLFPSWPFWSSSCWLLWNSKSSWNFDSDEEPSSLIVFQLTNLVICISLKITSLLTKHLFWPSSKHNSYTP